MKRIIASILLVAIMLLNVVAMASCNNSDNIDDIVNKSEEDLTKAGWDVPSVGYDGSEVTLDFFHTMGAGTLQPTLNIYIEEFNKLFPNIHINHQQVGGYDDVNDQIKTEIAGGNQPHIAYCYPDHVAAYNIARAVVPLDNLINSKIEVTDALGNKSILGLTDEQKADFVPGYYAEGAVYDAAGTMYTLPLSKSTEALYYNKTFFDAHPEIKVPTTWDEMEKACEQIKAIDPDCIPLGYDSESNWFITMCEQYGADYTVLSKDKDYFKFDNDKTRAFVERFKGWYDKGYVTTQELYGSYTSGLFTNTEPNAETGVIQRCYMVIGSTGGATHQHPPKNGDGSPMFETGMTTVPQVDPANPKVISQGPSLCIFKKANPQEVVASWLFVKFLTTNPGFQAAFSIASGYVPVIQSVQNDANYQKWLNSGNGVSNLPAMSVKVALSQVNAYYVSPAFNGSSDARKQVGLIMVNVFGGKSIDDEFKRAMEECKYAVQ